MSKVIVAVIGVSLGIACVSFAQDPVATYSMDNMVDPYAGPTPPGMRFSDVGHAVAIETGDAADGHWGGGCSMCRFGIHGVPCDADWSGPCIDWKLVGWYSNFHDKDRLWCEGNGHGCGRRCGHACGCDSCCE
ncbi:MAG: hypothetical protein WD063_11880 [Pirellulales bacterium]